MVFFAPIPILGAAEERNQIGQKSSPLDVSVQDNQGMNTLHQICVPLLRGFQIEAGEAFLVPETAHAVTMRGKELLANSQPARREEVSLLHLLQDRQGLAGPQLSARM